MDSHHKGRAINGYGANAGTRGLRVLFGTTLAGSLVLLKTTGATPAEPIFVELFGFATVAFNGTGPVVSLKSTDLDGVSNPATELAIADISAGQSSKRLLLTSDRIFSVLYTPATGAPTAGDMCYLARIQGMGQIQ